jgi:two-component system phosphate regulon sensor histidine kinase PhoR
LNSSLIGVKDGSVTLNPDDYPYDELKDMANKINVLASDISLQIEKLQTEKDKIGFILDNMKEGFILLDHRKNVLLINNSACTYMHCGKNVIGEYIVHCTQNFDFLETVDIALRDKGPKCIDMKVDGRIIESDFTVVEGQQDISGGLIIILTDVTENRDTIKMRRDFFSNVSHELKTPITSIKGSAELLLADIPLEDGQRRELLQRIGIETQRMDSLINDIIMINRMETGDMAIDKENIDLETIIRECRDEAEPLAERDRRAIQLDTEPAILFASRKNLYAMVSNLIVNAIKYNRPGGGVDIGLKNEGEEILLTIHNDGEYIAPEHQRRVFERFYRIDKGRSKTAGGTGLGLSIVKHVVDSLGGGITLNSDREKGTTFTVRLPKS